MPPKNRIESLMSGVQKREDDMVAEHRKRTEAYEAEIAAMPIRPEMLAAWDKAIVGGSEMAEDKENLLMLVAFFVTGLCVEATVSNEAVYGARLLTLAVHHMTSNGLNIAEARKLIQDHMRVAKERVQKRSIK